MNKIEVFELFEIWNSALQTKDPAKVASLYSKNAILLPTMSNKVRHNHEEIADYFVHFLAKDPTGVINEGNVRFINELAINSGVYTFSFSDKTSVQARFTYVYEQINGKWLIIEHHSSQMPEK